MSETTAPKLPIDLENKILSLQESVLQRLPQMPTLLQEIWNALKKQPENVTILEEEQVQIICSGLEIQTNTKLIESMTKTTKSKAAITKLKNLTVDDL